MKTLSKALLCLSVLTMAACASSPQQKEDADRKARSQVFFEGLQSQRATDVSGSCHSVPANAKDTAATQSWKNLIDEASACVKAGNWASVDGWAFEISRANADSPWGLYYYSVAALGTHDMARALWMVEAAMKKSNTSVAVFRYQKARVLWAVKPSEAALKEAQAALDIDPTMIDAHNFLGDAKFRTEDFKEATRQYEAALKLKADDAHALKGLELVQIQTGKAPERAVANAQASNAPVAKKASAEGAKK